MKSEWYAILKRSHLTWDQLRTLKIGAAVVVTNVTQISDNPKLLSYIDALLNTICLQFTEVVFNLLDFFHGGHIIAPHPPTQFILHNFWPVLIPLGDLFLRPRWLSSWSFLEPFNCNAILSFDLESYLDKLQNSYNPVFESNKIM